MMRQEPVARATSLDEAVPPAAGPGLASLILSHAIGPDGSIVVTVKRARVYPVAFSRSSQPLPQPARRAATSSCACDETGVHDSTS